MGVDKQNIRSVVHRNLSQSLESYLQEAGRGGRDRAPSQAVLLVSPSDLALPAQQPDVFQRARLQQLIDWILEPGCRRAAMLRRMGADPAPCFGCSSCTPPPQAATGSYWHRLHCWSMALACRKPHRRTSSLAVRQAAREHEWGSFDLPPGWMASLPWMPEWCERDAAAAFQELTVPAAIRAAWRQLLAGYYHDD
ncbi:hypothetical protein [Spirochaeta africana]|uniref:hypothetical protein n=1 Tax=Spirochaeta africana TaxID=46355 RepID=UPI0002473A0C|nr:hypothetical protein [Spirochaeta africana]